MFALWIRCSFSCSRVANPSLLCRIIQLTAQIEEATASGAAPNALTAMRVKSTKLQAELMACNQLVAQANAEKRLAKDEAAKLSKSNHELVDRVQILSKDAKDARATAAEASAAAERMEQRLHVAEAEVQRCVS